MVPRGTDGGGEVARKRVAPEKLGLGESLGRSARDKKRHSPSMAYHWAGEGEQATAGYGWTIDGPKTLLGPGSRVPGSSRRQATELRPAGQQDLHSPSAHLWSLPRGIPSLPLPSSPRLPCTGSKSRAQSLPMPARTMQKRIHARCSKSGWDSAAWCHGRASTPPLHRLSTMRDHERVRATRLGGGLRW